VLLVDGLPVLLKAAQSPLQRGSMRFSPDFSGEKQLHAILFSGDDLKNFGLRLSAHALL
jgi:hypothetical protein